MADIFGVVADSTRRDILRILLERYNQSSAAKGELSVSDIVSSLGLSQPTVSKHLKVLREAGLVGVREEGQHRYYHLDYAPLEEIEDWLIPFLSIDEASTVSGLDETEVLRTSSAPSPRRSARPSPTPRSRCRTRSRIQR
jgi:ArsR family transcriptional regulator